MDMIEIFKKLLLNIENVYANIYNKDYIQQEYLKHLFWKDELKTFHYNNEIISAKIVGINDFGQLLLQYNNDIIPINNKEIKYII
jgi:biotin-(acetyl-CoA carboxylase) ligase